MGDIHIDTRRNSLPPTPKIYRVGGLAIMHNVAYGLGFRGG
jgi:hypothetical protein